MNGPLESPWEVSDPDTFGVRILGPTRAHPQAREIGVPMQTRSVIALVKETTPGAAEHHAAMICALVNQREELLACLNDAVAFVELCTANGVQVQPRADVKLPNGDFSAEDIARNGRAVLARIKE